MRVGAFFGSILHSLCIQPCLTHARGAKGQPLVLGNVYVIITSNGHSSSIFYVIIRTALPLSQVYGSGDPPHPSPGSLGGSRLPSKHPHDGLGGEGHKHAHTWQMCRSPFYHFASSATAFVQEVTSLRLDFPLPEQTGSNNISFPLSLSCRKILVLNFLFESG